MQFQVRDADSADEDLRALLSGVDGEAALLFTCNGRGRHLFAEPNHDAAVVEELLGPVPLAGAFCAGEIGPIGGRNFLHSFTARSRLREITHAYWSLALRRPDGGLRRVTGPAPLPLPQFACPGWWVHLVWRSGDR